MSANTTLHINKPQTYMRNSYHLSLTQIAMQLNWSLYRTKRHHAYSTVQPANSHLVTWSNQVAILCGSCGHKLGVIVAFHTSDLYGLVEDTTRWAEMGKHDMREITTGLMNGKPRWMHVSGGERHAQVHFRCKRCRHSFQPRNAHRMSQKLVSDGVISEALKI
jgi:hypothetical protein